MEMFRANAWGLQEMHGNVWEWCLDYWRESYKGSPTDGSAWLKAVEQSNNASTKAGDDSFGDDRTMLLRGGSRGFDPRYCRSAYRYLLLPAYAYYYVGFRMVCLPQGPSLNP